MVLGEQGRAVSNKEAAGRLGIEAIWISCARRLKAEPPKEYFGGSEPLPGTKISKRPTRVQPQAFASAMASPKLS